MRKSCKKHSGLNWILGLDTGSGYFEESRNLALSFVLVAPLLLIYELALLIYRPQFQSSVGILIKDALALIFHSRAGMALNLFVALVLIFAVVILARRRKLNVDLIFPVLVESFVWAIVLLGMAVLITRRLENISSCAISPQLAEGLISSVGAGVYEELVFRLFGLTALYTVGMAIFKDDWVNALGLATLVTASAFAVCHTFQPSIFLFFYFIAGIFFALLFSLRGLGIAVYTHVIYDVIVSIL